MVTDSSSKAWKQFLQWAESRCSPTTFGNWLEPIRLLESSLDECIVLEIPNIFVKEYLLSHYKEELKAFLPVDSKGEPCLRFIVAERKDDPLPPIKSEEPAQAYHSANRFASQLNASYQFDAFIEGPANQFVKSAAIGVANRPGQSYNPLFIHGDVGLGKTHLLHGIGHAICEQKRNLRIHCITTEAFINDLVECLRSKSIEKMKRYYRSDVDVLLVDDIQFLQNRLNFEDEFCNTFEALIHQNKQLVITSDKPPSELKLSQRLIGRMEWGLVAQVGIPDLETRVAILQSKAQQKGLPLPIEVAFFIAERLDRNVRQLEGALNRLAAHSKLLGLEISMELAQTTLREIVRHTPSRPVSIEQILQGVATVFEVRVRDLKSSDRKKEIVVPRQVAMYLACKMVNGTLEVIGNAFGKTHSTLLHACKTIEKKIGECETLARLVHMVERHIKS